jgi:hypothetical protein
MWFKKVTLETEGLGHSNSANPTADVGSDSDEPGEEESLAHQRRKGRILGSKGGRELERGSSIVGERLHK